MSKSILYIINGFGMGNATRCSAHINYYASQYKIDVITSDKAHAYFLESNQIANLYQQNPLNLAKESRFGSWVYFLKYTPHFFIRIIKNYSYQKTILKQKKYAAVFFDSDYTFLLHRILNNDIRVFGINNSYEVLYSVFDYRNKFTRNLLGSLLIEALDFTLHYLFCHKVLVPCLDPNLASRKLNNKFVCLPALIRKELSLNQTQEIPQTILFMPTSSNVESQLKNINKNFFENYNILSSGFHTKNSNLIRNAEVLICNGGQSSVAECLFLNKKSLIIPLKNHIEQFINSSIASSYGHEQLDANCNVEDLKLALSNIKDRAKINNYLKLLEAENLLKNSLEDLTKEFI